MSFEEKQRINLSTFIKDFNSLNTDEESVRKRLRISSSSSAKEKHSLTKGKEFRHSQQTSHNNRIESNENKCFQSNTLDYSRSNISSLHITINNKTISENNSLKILQISFNLS